MRSRKELQVDYLLSENRMLKRDKLKLMEENELLKTKMKENQRSGNVNSDTQQRIHELRMALIHIKAKLEMMLPMIQLQNINNTNQHLTDLENMNEQIRDLHFDPLNIQNTNTQIFRNLQNTLERIVTPSQIQSNILQYKQKTKKFLFLRNDTQNNPLQQTECCICCQDYRNNEKIRLLKCKHIFHNKCLKGWFKQKINCPICKQSV